MSSTALGAGDPMMTQADMVPALVELKKKKVKSLAHKD